MAKTKRKSSSPLVPKNIFVKLCAGTDLVMICRAISKRHLFEYDLNDILSHLIYTRILYPSSKRSSFEEAKRFIEQPSYDEINGLRGYITTQPIKTLKDFLQQWCMAEDGWILDGDVSGKI